MDVHDLQDWNLTPAEARELQREMAPKVRHDPLDAAGVRLVAGCDCSFDPPSEGHASKAIAGYVSLTLPELSTVERHGARMTPRFPYVPGLLSFREIPPLLQAWRAVERRPDAILCDGHGLAHPRRFGLACHLGMILDLPTAGVAKSVLVGKHDPVPEAVGAWTPLVHRDEVVGAALRSRAGVSPIYVSVGHRIDLPSAIALVQRCLTRYRLPETTRHAHNYVNELRLNPSSPL